MNLFLCYRIERFFIFNCLRASSTQSQKKNSPKQSFEEFGLKWIIPIDLSEVNHQEYFKAVANYIHSNYGLEVDQSGKDISRACFLPHDPNVYLNPKYY